MKNIYQIYLEIEDVTPIIWRRIQIPSDLLLEDLHKILQVVMGWTNSHLHQFIQNEKYYSPRTDGDEDFWDESMNVDYKEVKISDLLKNRLDTVDYEYDYGDSWMHTLVLEDILPQDNSGIYHICLGGENHCPAEDCGGIGGYMELLKILKKPNSSACKEWREWLGDEFNPTYFDLDEVNAALRLPDYGLPKWDDFE
jgi:hypothetical protein